jgi:hypothetical protein
MTPLPKTLVAIATAALTMAAQADTLGQWNFNSLIPDNNTSSGTTLPSIGAGTASLVGGTTGSFSSGTANGGSSDPAATDNSGWQTTGYAAQGADARGVQFLVSTVGWQDIVLSYDLRHSNTSSRFESVWITLDGGTSFSQVASFDGNAGDTWFKQRTVDLSAISGADDNAGFGFRVLQTGDPQASGTSYLASSAGSSYASTGTWRFDMVTVNALAPVPEPGALALFAAGLGVVGSAGRRARRTSH